MSIPLIFKEDTMDSFYVKRTERIHTPYNEVISYYCHLSKNLWNQAQRIILEEYKEFDHIPSYEYIDAILNKKSYYKKNPEFDNYHKLGGATSQQILMIHNESWWVYKKAKKGFCTNPDKNYTKNYTGMPKEPKYKKKDGEFILIFTNKQCKIRNGILSFPKKIDKKPSKLGDLKIKVRFNDSYTKDGFDLYGNGLYEGDIKKNIKFDQVRIIPVGNGYWIEIVYDKEVIKNKENIRKDSIKYELEKLNKIILSLDLGVENLAAMTDNIGSRPIIIKGSEIKSVNQWYNKKKSELQSIYDRNPIGTACLIKIDKKEKKVNKNLDKKGRIKCLANKSGSKLEILTENRNNRIKDEFHKLSRGIVNQAIKINADTIVIGRNPLWKQRVKIGKRNNQNFVNIPHSKLIEMIKYKTEEYGIDVIDRTEEYTSRCSFLDSEPIKYHEKYMGKRGKKGEKLPRGLFEASKGTKINSDVNGSLNILRNVSPKFNVYDIMEGIAVHGLVPERLSVSDLLNSTN